MQSIQFSAYFVPSGGLGCKDTTQKLNREFSKPLAKLPINLELIYHRQWNDERTQTRKGSRWEHVYPTDRIRDSITLRITQPTLWQRLCKKLSGKGVFIQALPPSLSPPQLSAFLKIMTAEEFINSNTSSAFASRVLEDIIQAIFNPAKNQQRNCTVNLSTNLEKRQQRNCTVSLSTNPKTPAARVQDSVKPRSSG